VLQVWGSVYYIKWPSATYWETWTRKYFITSKEAKLSVENYKNNKLHQCQYCSKVFNHNGNLQKHLRTHTGEKTYQCQYCIKESSSLQTQLTTHTEEYPYQFKYCSEVFNHSSSLQRNLRIHTGEKPYQCQFCSEAW